MVEAPVQPQPQPIVLQPGQVIQGHEIVKPLGKGKFSIVYMAKRLSDQLVCALKKINIFDMLQPKQREKCLKEVRLLQSLDHPNIVKLLEAIVDENELLIIVDWAEKGDLKRLIRKAQQSDTRFKEPQIWEYSRQLAGALDHMHGKRIMHRDLKPANIFVAQDGSLKLGDLGLGRIFSSETLEAFSKVGTPLYMSPEVLHGAGYDMRSDVWSLGCVLYELAMLRSPFKSDQQLSLYDLFVRISKGQYPPLSEVCSPELRALVSQMLFLEAVKRPHASEVLATCRARVAAMAAAAAAAPPAAPPAPAAPSGAEDAAGGEAAIPSGGAGVGEAAAGVKADTGRTPGSRPSPLLVMDDIVEKLKLLECEERLLRPRGYPLLHRCFFAQQVTLPGELTQFEVMYELFRWLLSLLRQREERERAAAHGNAALPLVVPAAALAADASAGPCLSPGAGSAALPTKGAQAPSDGARAPVLGAEADAGIGAGDAAAGGGGTAARTKPPAQHHKPPIPGRSAGAATRARVRLEDAPALTDVLLSELQARGLDLQPVAARGQLERGHGECVCLLLNDLINQELLGRDFHFESPVWGEAPRDEEAAALEVEEEEVGLGEDADPACSQGEDEDPNADGASEGAHDGSGGHRGLPFGFAGSGPASGSTCPQLLEPIHTAQVDPEAWRAEVERVRPSLKVTARASDSFGGWRTTVATARSLARTVCELQPSDALASSLRSCAARWADELDRLRRHEDRLNAALRGRVEELARLRASSVEAAERLSILQAGVAALSAEHASLSQQLDAARGESDKHSEDLCGQERLTSLKRSLRQLVEEDRQLSVRLSLLQRDVLHRREASSRQERAGVNSA